MQVEKTTILTVDPIWVQEKLRLLVHKGCLKIPSMNQRDYYEIYRLHDTYIFFNEKGEFQHIGEQQNVPKILSFIRQKQ